MCWFLVFLIFLVFGTVCQIKLALRQLLRARKYIVSSHVCVCVVCGSVELRELEAMLKAAYVSKAHVTQMAEKAAQKTEEKAMDVAAAHVMLEQCRREEEAEQQKELAKYHRMRKHHLEIKRQMEVMQPHCYVESSHVITIMFISAGHRRIVTGCHRAVSDGFSCRLLAGRSSREVGLSWNVLRDNNIIYHLRRV